MTRRTRSILILPLLLAWLSAARADPIEDLTNTGRKFIQAAVEGDLGSVKEITTPEFYLDLQSANGLTFADKISPDIDLADLGGVTKAYIRGTEEYSEFSVYEIEALHTSGQSSWNFRFDDAGKIAGAVFLKPPPVGVDGPTYRSPPARDRASSLQGCPSRSAGCPRLGPPPTPEREVEFYFATDRKPKAGSSPIVFIADRQAELSFGAVSVRVPEDHEPGKIELPAVWKVFGYELYREKADDQKHFSIKRESVLSYSDWIALLKQQMRSPKPATDPDGWDPGGALVFVHGYDNSFEDAVYRYAQIIWDLRYRGLAILYSWSSKGGVVDYRYDLESANNGREGFINLLSKLQNELGIKKINVIAHSMGNFIVVDSLNNNSATAKPLRLDHVVMAAPDVDRKMFSRAIPNLHKIVKGMTLYASAADKALRISAGLAESARAGDVLPFPDGPLILPYLDTIDVTALGDEFLGLNHAEFATNRIVMKDIKSLLQGKGPPRVDEMRPVPKAPARARYWRYEKVTGAQ